MRILYDGYIFSAQRNGGISRYFANLIQRLPHDWFPIIFTGDRPNSVEVIHPSLRGRAALPFAALRPRVLGGLLNRSYLELLDFGTAYDILHPTYHLRLGERWVRPGRRPLVVTVFDMILERYSSELDPEGSEIEAKRSMIESADAIICISENTKRELQERYSIPDTRITVTYLASGINWTMATKAAATPERPYCLFLGNRGIYKNFLRTLLAFGKIAEEWPDVTLCVVGDALSVSETELIKALKLWNRVTRMAFVDDSHLAGLYRNSEALIYPSLEEGFGIPPLEAMACGTVVISSNTSSLPEVVGDAAIMIDPESIGDMADAIISLRNMGARRDELIERGLKRAALFSWEETTRRTVGVYESVAS